MNVSASKVQRSGIGGRKRDLLERLHRGGSGGLTADDAARLLGLERAESAQLLQYLARRGWLSRVRPGLYVPVPLEARRSGEWVEDPWIVAARTFEPCYIGGWSAIEHWDLTEQVFRTLLVVTSRRVRSRDVVLQGIPIRLTVRPDKALFGTVPVWRGLVRVPVSDPSRTIVDVLDDPRIGGGMRNVADVLGEYLSCDQRNDQLLVEYGDRLGNRTVFKRLGYLLERGGIDAPQLVEECLARRSSGLARLDPSMKAPGRIVRRWGLRVNVAINSYRNHA